MIHFDTQSRFVHSSILDKPRKSLFSSHKSSTTSLCLCEPYYSLLIWFLYYSDCRNNSCTHLNPVVQRSAVKIKFVKGKMVVNWDLVPEIIDSGPMYITDLFQNKSVAYFNRPVFQPKIKYFPKTFWFFLTFMLCNFLERT